MDMNTAIRDKLLKWREKSNSIKILITGKTGTGKSSLINSIIGRDVAVEGDTLKPQTLEIELTNDFVGEVELQVWDSPGLQDGIVNEDGKKTEEKYIQKIAKECSQYDLIIYTIRMSQSKILKSEADCRAMELLSDPDALGLDMWENAIFVLTFANVSEKMARYKVNQSDSLPMKIKLHKIFKTEFQDAVSAIQNILIKGVGLTKEQAQSIPIVPAGYKKDSPTLPVYNCEITDGSRFHWLSDLWLKALAVTKLDAKPALIKINEHRMVESQEEYEGRLLSAKQEIAHQMPLIFSTKGGDIGKALYHTVHGDGAIEGPMVGTQLGNILSLAILAKQTLDTKNKILTRDEQVELQKSGVCDFIY